MFLLSVWKPARGGVVTHVEKVITRLPYDFEIVSYPRIARIPLLRALLFVACGLVSALAKSRRRRFDIVHAHYAAPQGVLGLILKRLLRIPLVVTVHGTDINYLGRRRLTRAVIARVLQGADVVVAVSRHLKREAEALGAERVKVIYNGVEVPAEAEGEREPIVLFVGSLVRQKGVDVLLRAFRRVKERIPKARLVIVGDGQQRAKLEKMCKKMGLKDVHFEGTKSELSGYYSKAKVLALPSRAEGFGLVALEAMAHGTPVVASEVGGIPEVVADGETGFLVKPEDADALAEALTEVLRNRKLWERLSSASRRRAAEFSWDAAAEGYRQIYRELVG